MPSLSLSQGSSLVGCRLPCHTLTRPSSHRGYDNGVVYVVACSQVWLYKPSLFICTMALCLFPYKRGPPPKETTVPILPSRQIRPAEINGARLFIEAIHLTVSRDLITLQTIRTLPILLQLNNRNIRLQRLSLIVVWFVVIPGGQVAQGNCPQDEILPTQINTVQLLLDIIVYNIGFVNDTSTKLRLVIVINAQTTLRVPHIYLLLLN